MKRIYLFLILICTGLIFTGCASTSITDMQTQRERISLKAGDTGAIISIFVNAHIDWDDVTKNENGQYDFDVFDPTSRKSSTTMTVANIALDEKAKKENDIEKMKKRSMTYPFINEVDDAVLDAFENTYHYNLVAPEVVTGAASYQELNESKSAKIMEDIRYFERPDNYAYLNVQEIVPGNLSEEIGADYFIVVQTQLYKSMKVNLYFKNTGIMAPKAISTITFFDKNGKLLAATYGECMNEANMGVFYSHFNTEKFYSLCVDTIKSSIEDALWLIDNGIFGDYKSKTDEK